MQYLLMIGLSLLLHLLFPHIDTTENSLLEDLQAVVIALAMLLYLYRIIYGHRLQQRIINTGIALLLFSFLIRELDVEEFMVLPEMMRYYLGKEGKDITMGILWGSYILFYMVGTREKLKQWRIFWGSREGSLWACAFVLLLLSQMMDKNVLHLHHHLNRYYEEFWELFSYMYIMIAAWSGMRQTGQSAGL